MAKTNFENLRVDQLSESLADHIWDIVEMWPVFARDTVGKQIVRGRQPSRQPAIRSHCSRITL
jgi:hypothetical protein